MKRTIGLTVVLTALATAGAMEAQEPVEDGVRSRRGPSVEAIMQMRDRLELSDAQIGDLDALRAERVQARVEEMAELEELRSLLAAGQIERSEVMAFMERQRDANAGSAEELQTRLDALLTAEQLESLDELRRRGRAFERGRRSARAPRDRFRGSRPDRSHRQRFRRDGPRRGPSWTYGRRGRSELRLREDISPRWERAPRPDDDMGDFAPAAPPAVQAPDSTPTTSTSAGSAI